MPDFRHIGTDFDYIDALVAHQ
jgi:hypothetical protein